MKDIKSLNFFTKLNEKGKGNFILIIGVVGILLIFLSDYIPKDNKTIIENSYSLTEYKSQIEKEISALLKEINGVGNVKVMITMESTEETIYVQEEKNIDDQQKNSTDKSQQETVKSTYENQVVIVGGSNTQTALIEKTIQPTIQGVAIVCTGGDDISVISAVTNSVSVVLNLPTHKICVTKMR